MTARSIPAAAASWPDGSRAAAVLLWALAAPLTTTSAQEPHALSDGFGDSTRVAAHEAWTRCVTPLRTNLVWAAADSTCQLVGFRPLGTAGGLAWSVARYRRSVVFDDSLDLGTMDLDELALFARAGPAPEERLVWHLVRDRDFEFLDTLRWVATTRDIFLVVTLCLNGTGGCGDEYLRFADGGWRPLEQPFARALQARLPRDHWLHKGRRLDLETLTGIWPVAAPGDGNCCPSLELPFSLELVGDTLLLREAGTLRAASRR